jgi:hypothetical protein
MTTFGRREFIALAQRPMNTYWRALDRPRGPDKL